MADLYLHKPYPQQITTQDELYKLSYTVAREVAPGLKYSTKLAILGWSKEDLASEAYIVSLRSIQFPIDYNLAWQVLKRDMEDCLRPRKKDETLVSLSNLDHSDDPEATGTLGDTILSDVINHGAQHTKCPESLLIDSQTPADVDQIDPTDLPAVISTLPTIQEQVIRMLFLSSKPSTCREVALALGVSKSTIARVREEALVNLSKRIVSIYVGQNQKSSITSVGEVNDSNTRFATIEDSSVVDSIIHSRTKKASKRRKRHERALPGSRASFSSLEDGPQNSQTQAQRYGRRYL